MRVGWVVAKNRGIFKWKYTGTYGHLLMEMDLQAQIQTSFQSSLEQLLFALQFYSVSLQIYILPVCVWTGLCWVSSSPGLGLCLTGWATSNQQSPCSFYMDTRIEAQVTMLAQQKLYEPHHLSSPVYSFFTQNLIQSLLQSVVTY